MYISASLSVRGVHMCGGCVCTCVSVHRETRGQPWVQLLRHCPPFFSCVFLRLVLSQCSEHLPLPPSTPTLLDEFWGSTQVPVLIRQALCPLSCLPSPPKILENGLWRWLSGHSACCTNVSTYVKIPGTTQQSAQQER